LWAVYGGLRAAGVPGVVRVMKADGAEDDPDARPEEDPTLTEELLLAALLAAAFLSLARSALRRLWRLLRRQFDAESLTEALEVTLRAGTKAVPLRQRDEIDRLLERAVANGALDASVPSTASPETRVTVRPERPVVPPASGRLRPAMIGAGTALSGDRPTQAAWSSLRRLTHESPGNYFETVVVPMVRRALQPLLEEARAARERGEDYTPNFTEVQRVVDAQVALTSRWRVVANATVSRAYHYAFLRTAELGGIVSYTWVTVGDERVCAICLDLGGRSFPVREALELMNQIAASDDPDAAKNILPWPKTVEELRARAVMIPPAHGRCRCTIRVRRDSVSVPSE
jgi:hypothetical protein